MRLRKTKLKNGFLLVEARIPEAKTTSLHIAFPAGARYEHDDEEGIAHFLEHLVFKGGEKFLTTKEIIRAAERLGAKLNAFTSHDFVNFHITGRTTQLPAMAELLTDFVLHPRLRVKDIDAERGVVLQEIARKNDDWEQLAYSLLSRAAYGDHPLGHEVLGTAKTIKNFTCAQIVRFRKRQCAPQGAVAVVAGTVTAQDRRALIALLETMPGKKVSPSAVAAPPAKRRVLVKNKKTEQSHLRLYWSLLNVDSDDLKTAAALAVYLRLLGGGIGSRLGEEIRVQRGLCYNIYADNELHSDCEGLYVSSGLQSSRCLEAYKLICDMVATVRRTRR